MGKTNTSRVEHNLGNQPNAFRDDDLKQIINDLGEEDTGLGFSEVLKVPGPFVSSLITWVDSGKTQKRAETTFNRTGAFVSSIVKEIYSEDGLSVVATITTILTRDGNNQVVDTDVTVTRP